MNKTIMLMLGFQSMTSIFVEKAGKIMGYVGFLIAGYLGVWTLYMAVKSYFDGFHWIVQLWLGIPSLGILIFVVWGIKCLLFGRGYWWENILTPIFQFLAGAYLLLATITMFL